MKKEWEKDLEVDRGNLEAEWERQSGLYMYYAEKLTDEIDDRDRLREELDKVKAELDKDIRSNPAKYGLEKTTDTPVANCILLQKKYIDELEKVRESTHKVNTYQNVIRALDHKKKALESLVQLYISGYNATPREKSPDKKDSMETKTNTRLRKKIRDDKEGKKS